MNGHAATSLGRTCGALRAADGRHGQTRWKSSLQNGSACSSGVSTRVAASAKSARPLRTASMQGSDSTSATANSMPGCAARKPASTLGSQSAASDGSSAIETRPRRSAARSLDAGQRSVDLVRARGAPAARTRLPSAVSSTIRVLRSNRRMPSDSSSWRINALNAGCDRWLAAAARVKFLSLRQRR